MYKKTCPICGEEIHDDDPDRLITHMKAHLAKHKEDDDLAASVIPATANTMKDGTKMKQAAANTMKDENTKQAAVARVEDETQVALGGFMSPAATLKEAMNAFDMFDKAKAQLLRDTDVLWFGGAGKPVAAGTTGAKPYLLKSAWRRMARFFGLSIDIEGREKIENGARYMWVYRYRITHPCGAYIVSEGVCSSEDSFFTKGGKVKADEADVMLKAQTVALNRGISDLLGSGEVSADEMLKVGE